MKGIEFRHFGPLSEKEAIISLDIKTGGNHYERHGANESKVIKDGYQCTVTSATYFLRKQKGDNGRKRGGKVKVSVSIAHSFIKITK